MKSVLVRLGMVAFALGFTTTAQAQASAVSYTYIDARVNFSEIDVSPSGEIDADGPQVSASLQLHENIHLLGEFERLSRDDILIDDGLGNVTAVPLDDLDTYAAGVGFHTPTLSRGDRQYRGGLADGYSLFAEARYLRQDSGASNSNGWAANIGLRAVNYTRLESILGIGYEDFEDQSGEFTAQGQILFRLVGNLQLRGGIDWNENVTRWNLGLRYHFGDFSVL
ncbi:MAG: hypothetical protein ACE5G3_11890 [Gammaproteobacteria bacterium]